MSGNGKKNLPVRRKRRPDTPFTDDLVDEICTRIAAGESLRSVCKDDHIPHAPNVIRWLFDGKHQEFADKYALARKAQAEHWADEIMDIADDGTNDYVERQTRQGAIIVADNEHINRSRLRVDSRKWMLSKVLPRVYGDRSTTEHVGDPARPISVMAAQAAHDKLNELARKQVENQADGND